MIRLDTLKQMRATMNERSAVCSIVCVLFESGGCTQVYRYVYVNVYEDEDVELYVNVHVKLYLEVCVCLHLLSVSICVYQSTYTCVTVYPPECFGVNTRENVAIISNETQVSCVRVATRVFCPAGSQPFMKFEM